MKVNFSMLKIVLFLFSLKHLLNLRPFPVKVCSTPVTLAFTVFEYQGRREVWKRKLWVNARCRERGRQQAERWEEGKRRE